MNKNLTSFYQKLSKSEKRYIDISLSKIKRTKLRECFISLSKKQGSQHSALCQTRLLDHMIKALTNYHGKHLKDFTSNLKRYQAEILEMKQLSTLSYKYLIKAKKEAYKYKQFPSILKIIEFEMLSLKNEGIQLEKSRQQLKSLHEEEKYILTELTHLSEIRFETLDFLLLSRNKIGPLDDLVTKDIKTKLNRFEALVDIDNNPEFAIYLYNLRGMYSFNEGNYNDCLSTFSQTIQLIEKQEFGSQIYAREYFFALNNHLISSVLTGDFDLFKKTRRKIKSRFETDPSFEYQLFSTTLMYEIGLFNQMGLHTEVLELETNINEGLQKHVINNINRHIFYFNLAIAHFACQNFMQANKYIIELVTDIPQKRSSSASNIYFYALIISLIIRLERSEYDYLRDLIGDIETQLLKIRPLNEFETNIMIYLKNVSQHPKNIKLLNFHLARKTIFKPSTHSAFAQQFFDFRTWMKSKLQNKSMQIIRQEVQKISV
jgi:hypothetical protein